MKKITHFGWQVSPYSAKTRSYLRYANIPFDDVAPSFKTLMLKIKPAVGEAVMPTVRLPDASYLKDSSNIIDYFERLSHSPSITPDGCKQRIASAVLEVYADEWLPMAALHYRWNRPENARFAIAEFGRSAAPWLPRPLQKMIGREIAAKMRRYLSVFGITSKTQAEIERSTEQLLDDMNEVLQQQPYLFGFRPSLGDFSLYGPLYAHLFRDPATTPLFATRHALREWILRMHTPKSQGDFSPSDRCAPGVERILKRAFTEQWAYLEGLVKLIDAFVEQNPGATRVPRALGSLEFCVGNARATRKAVTFAQWKMQRACETYAKLDFDSQRELDDWLTSLGGKALTRSPAHPLFFDGHHVKLKK